MKRLSLVLLVTVWACIITVGSAPGEEPPGPLHPATKADRPPRKVVVGTVIFGPYGKYDGLEERMKELSGFIDAMAADAIKKYPGRGLDLAILPLCTLKKLSSDRLNREPSLGHETHPVRLSSIKVRPCSAFSSDDDASVYVWRLFQRPGWKLSSGT